MEPRVSLINWDWFEDLLVRACEGEIRRFGSQHPEEPVFACCLEFDALFGALYFSYGTHDAVERAVRGSRKGRGSRSYREVELNPVYWSFRRVPQDDPDGSWEEVGELQRRHRENMALDSAPETVEFLWLRFEYLVECVVRRLIDRGAFRHLSREAEFLAYCATEEDSLEELEDRLEKLYPMYRRATMELTDHPRAGTYPSGRCGGGCRGSAERPELRRCTYCQTWLCSGCSDGHTHAELLKRQPLFL
ncbi:MAG: hypothetical protein ACK47B_06290 [Armatimonadota bacterium]